jgi:hypothetical protein
MCDQLLQLAAILAQWQHLVASSEALDLLHGHAHSNLLVHCHGHQNGQQSRCIFTLLCLLFPWRLLEQYRGSSCPMAVSRGLWCSPGHAATGNSSSLAPMHPCGHQNGQQRKDVCSSSLISSSTITLAKQHGNTSF